ncbi:Uncharacterized protein TPAR_08242 [Tolypocladium paradoxum]|uniref:CFEM domain-containing protein n=1 Tax=Tolypocladium paradoxum TaxID=94208 RepID=A0A2S4KN41_9HYPO|nr:Uncharacterized protein TPAR_08242 [Tolypocladium paradoxum]
MKFAAVAALAFAALASAQSRSDIPSCALPCLDDAVQKDTKCSVDDFSCICKNFDAIQGDATGCVLKACGPDVALNKVLPATQALCEKLKNGGGQSSSAAASSAPASSAPTSSAPASSAPASSAPASSAPASSAPASSASATETGQPTGTITSSQTTLMPTASRSTNSTSPTTPAALTGGAAGFAPIGGLAMLALGALAL